MKTLKLQVQGMSCGHCVQSVEKAVKELGAEAKVDLAGGSVTVDYDENGITVEAIKEAIEEQGYDVAE
ncbi:copper ion binding protein [Paenibacillus gansuensis]|uniref:Copper ion binding protein n=1 Tax=Paenibacillus gansuensis TaxID=306542 RepID=A0ABW5PDG1_9BACL